MGNVIDLVKKQPTIEYHISLFHHADDSLEIHVLDVDDDLPSRRVVAAAMRRAAKALTRAYKSKKKASRR